jgi:hypothetical protein
MQPVRLRENLIWNLFFFIAAFQAAISYSDMSQGVALGYCNLSPLGSWSLLLKELPRKYYSQIGRKLEPKKSFLFEIITLLAAA